jgi:hypothetical protein
MATTTASAQPLRVDRTGVIVLGITLLALVLRVVYFLGAEVDTPIRGDILEYWRYARNLVHYGVFSAAAPDVAPLPDDYRGPGYALFLALFHWLANGDEDAALAMAQWSQILVGTALVPLTMAVGRRWLPLGWAIAAGALVAVWPHLVVFASTLLSETLFAFMILLAWLLLARAQAADSARQAAVAGLVAGFATLVNPLLALLPPVLAAVLALRRQWRCAAAFALLFVVVEGAWAWRNAAVVEHPSGTQRALVNLVQGSWPSFLSAMNFRDKHPAAQEYVDVVVAESERMHADPAATFAAMGARFRGEPGLYARWYLYDKPLLLWDWSIRIGYGDIYYHGTLRSPYERMPVLIAMRAACLALNPVLLALAVLATLAVAWRAVRRRWPAGAAAAAPQFAPLVVALCFVYVTAIHAVLQGEPRYAVAYRPLEFLLAVSALAWAVAWWRARGARAA